MSETKSEREEFEQHFSITGVGIRWNDIGGYQPIPTPNRPVTWQDSDRYNFAYKAFKAGKNIAHKKNESVVEALEKAAVICDNNHYSWRIGDNSGPKECAEEIRALIPQHEIKE